MGKPVRSVDEKRAELFQSRKRVESLRRRAAKFRKQAREAEDLADQLEHDAIAPARDIGAHDFDPIAGKGLGVRIFGHASFWLHTRAFGTLLSNGHLALVVPDGRTPPTSRAAVTAPGWAEDRYLGCLYAPRHPWPDLETTTYGPPQKGQVSAYKLGGRGFAKTYVDALRWQSVNYSVFISGDEHLLSAYTADGQLVGVVAGLRS